MSLERLAAGGEEVSCKQHHSGAKELQETLYKKNGYGA